MVQNNYKIIRKKIHKQTHYENSMTMITIFNIGVTAYERVY